MNIKTLNRAKLYGLLGDLPPIDRPISARTLSVEQCGSYILEHLILDLTGIEPVPAWFVKPAKYSGKLPVVLFAHSHGGNYNLGKDELIKGNTYMQQPCYAQELTNLGYAALCIDTWCFNERKHNKETELFKKFLWTGRVLWGMMVYEHLRAIDYLQTREDVDIGRLAAMGMSLGSTQAWWTAALDTRVKVCMDICCLTEYDSLIRDGGLDRHGWYYYVPSLLKHFSTADINALISPRRHLSTAGLHDALTPQDGLDLLEVQLAEIYSRDGAPNAFELKRYDTGHNETPEMRKDILEYLKTWL